MDASPRGNVPSIYTQSPGACQAPGAGFCGRPRRAPPLKAHQGSASLTQPPWGAWSEYCCASRCRPITTYAIMPYTLPTSPRTYLLIAQMNEYGRNRENRPFSPIYPCCITLPLTGLIQHEQAAPVNHSAEPSRGTARSARSRPAQVLCQATRAWEPVQESPWAALPASAGWMRGAATQAMPWNASLRSRNVAAGPLTPQPEGTPRLQAARCVAHRPRCAPLHRLLLAPCVRPESAASQPHADSRTGS